MDSERASIDEAFADLGRRWEILDTGITVKLYPSCAGTHPSLDAILDLRREAGFGAGDVERIDIDVDSITPTVLLYERPSSGLEGKFSMPFCAAAAVVHGRVGIDTFDAATLTDPKIAALMPRVTMTVDRTFDGAGPALTQARVRIALRDGRVLTRQVNGARGYPASPPSREELEGKFLACAERVLPRDVADRVLARLREVDSVSDVQELTAALIGQA
jgi:2-methylcitrate dehydratase PrpD